MGPGDEVNQGPRHQAAAWTLCGNPDTDTCPPCLCASSPPDSGARAELAVPQPDRSQNQGQRLRVAGGRAILVETVCGSN